MRCEAAIVLARQLAEQPILRARTDSGHLMLIVAVASLADGTNGAKEAPPMSKGWTGNSSIRRPAHALAGLVSTRLRQVAGRTPFLQRRSTRRPRPRGPPGRGL